MTGYNYFMEAAKRNLFGLLKIDDPTPEQTDLAERFIYSVERYGASKKGH